MVPWSSKEHSVNPTAPFLSCSALHAKSLPSAPIHYPLSTDSSSTPHALCMICTRVCVYAHKHNLFLTSGNPRVSSFASQARLCRVRRRRRRPRVREGDDLQGPVEPVRVVLRDPLRQKREGQRAGAGARKSAAERGLLFCRGSCCLLVFFLFLLGSGGGLVVRTAGFRPLP